MNKYYKINSQNDFDRIAFATLKKVFSVTVFPKVLTNIENQKLLKDFKKNAQITTFFTKNKRIFAKNVHIGAFDIGLFFVKFKRFYRLYIFDGNGLPAGGFITNIFDGFMFCTYEQFLQKKRSIIKEYKKIYQTKLMVQ